MSLRKLSECAMIAAIYTALSLALAPFSFGTVQVRVAEALCLLPVLSPTSVIGVTLGCAITNAAGIAMGASLLGPLDIVLGTFATLAAALLTRKLRRIKTKGLYLLSSLPPVILNAVIVGAELTFAFSDGFSLPFFALQAASVAIGELISCSILGIILVKALERTGLDIKLFKRGN